jgi:hypothetical protein
MSLIACMLMCHGPDCVEHYGIAIVNSVTGLPLPLSRNTFKEIGDADEFVEWAGSLARKADAQELAMLVEEFRKRESAAEES